MEYDEYFELMGTETTGRYDVTPLVEDPVTFENLRADLVADISCEPTAVCGIDALGFVLGSAVAVDTGVGFVPIRKGGKLPYPPEQLHQRSFIDYSDTTKSLELRAEALSEDDHVLLVDDWVETGAQMNAATAIVEEAGASVGAITTVNAARNDQTEPLFDAYDIYSLQ